MWTTLHTKIRLAPAGLTLDLLHMEKGHCAHAQLDRGGAELSYACAFGGGGAESMTFDLKTGDRRVIQTALFWLSSTLKCSVKGKRLKYNYTSIFGAIWWYARPCTLIWLFLLVQYRLVQYYEFAISTGIYFIYNNNKWPYLTKPDIWDPCTICAMCVFSTLGQKMSKSSFCHIHIKEPLY